MSCICLTLAAVLWKLRPITGGRFFDVEKNGEPLAMVVNLADRWALRQVGLLNHTQMPEQHGLWMRPSKQIHTEGMRFAIDVVFMDEGGRVLDVVTNVRPGLSLLRGPAGTRQCLELAAGSVGKRLDLRPGDRLTLTAQPVD